MSITIQDIALKAGVSITTVSRVLNGKIKKYRINEKTAERIIRTAKELHYRPNILARSLRLKKTKTIGLVIPDISNPFFAYVTKSIQTTAYQAGYSLVVVNTDENINTEIEQIELLRSKGVDGFVIMPVGIRYDHIEALQNDHGTVVLLDRCFDELETHSVVVDNHSGAFQAVTHLIEKGHRRIAIIQGLLNTYTNNQRVKGYRDALQRHGIRIDEHLIVGKDFRKENGYIEMKLLLNQSERPTAIFTTSDLITLGALQAVYEEQLRIPDDISLVAFDDIDFAPFLMAPLTAVSQPKELMGELAVKLLIDQLKSKGKTDKKRIVLNPHLIVRKSVLDLRPESLPGYALNTDTARNP
ncbi:LacI family DNA-binding transcriptional regulator [bacterium]|nr:LacI family DNA-binding transcriptional regulator [bacterium]